MSRAERWSLVYGSFHVFTCLLVHACMANLPRKVNAMARRTLGVSDGTDLSRLGKSRSIQ